MRGFGIVVIGRNEGERLVRCLKSLLGQISGDTPIVYVDSGSSDNSVTVAQSLGVHAIELDPAIPFTMARGRNTGFQYLVEHFRELKYVQFIDGDCELLPGWIDEAIAALEQDKQLAIVCGRRRERFPDASIYNRLADIEWNTLIGEAEACGGDALARIEAIQSVNGYNPELICGEEPEMCIRLRHKGWKIRRLDVDMTLHDAEMLRFGQWWKRSIRAGWAVAQGKHLHGIPPENYMIRQNFSGWLWGLIVPAVAFSLSCPTHGFSLTLFLGYLMLMWRIYRLRLVHREQPSHAMLYAFFCTLSKFPQLIGQVKYSINQRLGKTASLIEYKSPAS